MTMKILFALLFSVILFVTCNQRENNKADVKTNKPRREITLGNNNNFTKSYEGSINGNHKIIMTLSRSANSLNGTYTYKKKGEPIKISGAIDEYGNLKINEFDHNGKVSGMFKGQMIERDIVGQWISPNESQVMPFSISESQNFETAYIKSNSINPDVANSWTATYINGNEKTLRILGPDSLGEMKFEIIIANDKCASSIEGSAYLSKKNFANFNDKNGSCHLNFSLNNERIIVNEFDCQDYRGTHCESFEGTYIRDKIFNIK